ncbi:hypothetical protein [Nocardia mexicana]|uniref:Uncharacterized protein n=1 Tax=Nocardia mexicana TaxID=279262 RepID=A0A370GZ59_9NOCA|nr:hypothetical protein [Nocardia mexicana]RDI48954.1 hypothetical protein DFR68_10779 [Nocardia mexicana]
MAEYEFPGVLLKGYRLACVAGTVVAVVVTMALSTPTAALWVLFPAVVVMILTYPWLSPLESASRSRRTIALLCCAAFIAGLPWILAWWGLGLVVVPAAVVILSLYAFGARVAAKELWPQRHWAPGSKCFAPR